jgi:uncharacterized OB-fold protein
MTELREHPIGIPVPAPSALTQPYWDGCARGELLYQRCTSCGGAIFDPAPICRFCNSTSLEWAESSGRGSVYSWSIVWRPQTPAFNVPYAAAIVDLDEGYQIVANIIGCEPEDIRLGMPVQVEFHEIGSGFSLPYFRPLAS